MNDSSPTLSPGQADSPTVHHFEQNPAQLLLQGLRQHSLIMAEDWGLLPAAVQDELKKITDIATLLAALVRHNLLTEYQSQRIGKGETYGLILGNYRILERIGSGGMGVVYRGEHRLMRRQVAIKVVSVLGTADQESQLRFFAELRAVSHLQHPNIIGVFDAGELTSNDSLSPTLYYYVMEYIPGQSLEGLVKSSGPLSVEQACDLVCQIAGALEKAHQHDLIHRDIKPPNIMITPEGQAKLLDFGLVRDLRHRVTKPGIPLGTLTHMAPEQAHDASNVDVRVDVYGLGSTLFWTLTGKAPFTSQNSMAKDLITRLTQAAPSLRQVRPNLPEALDKVVAKMMAFNREERFPSMLAVRQALMPFVKTPVRGDIPTRLGALPKVEIPHAPASVPASGQKQHAILVVDDEKEIRNFCKHVLKLESLHCDEAEDGAAALQAVQAKPYDLVLMDCEMPRLDGLATCQQLREKPPCSNLKIILMSGRVPSDEMAQMMLTGADDFLAKPFSPMQLRARIKAALRLKEAQDRTNGLVDDLLTFNQELEHAINARDIDLIQARNAIVLALAKLAEYRDNETGAHLMRLERYCRCLAKEAAHASVYPDQINNNFIEMLACCAPLHDIGKVGVPDYILLKPGKLDPEEHLIMQTHTIIGSKTLLAVARQHGFALPMLHLAADVARSHHERFDGKGYPDHLIGTDIPLAARLVSIADVYDALRSRRVYKPALTHEQTLEAMFAEFSTQFDPALLQPFQKAVPQFEQIYAEYSE